MRRRPPGRRGTRPPSSATTAVASFELHDDVVDLERGARRRVDLLHHAGTLGLEDVFHLHRLDGGQRLALLHLLAFGDRDLHDQAGHRAEQVLRGVRRQLLGHQLSQFVGARGADVHLQIRAPHAHAEAHRDQADLQHQRVTADIERRERMARHPVRGDALVAAVILEGDGRALVVGRNVQMVFAALQRHHPFVAHHALVIAERARDPRLPDLGDAVHRRDGGRHVAQRLFVELDAVEAFRVFLGDEGGGDVALDEAVMVHHRRDEGQVVTDALDLEGVEREPHLLDRLEARRRPGAELGDHRVVIHRDLAALEHPGVVAHDATARRRAFDRRAVLGQPADRRQELAIGVFGIEPAFDRPAVDLQIRLLERQLAAIGDVDHLLDQVDAGDQFGDRMFHLQAGVHLEEVEVLVPVDDEFHGAGRGVAHGLRQRDGLLAHRLARRRVEERRGRLFDDLLVAALDRAFALVQIDAVAVLVAEHLDLDVARLGHELLDEDAVVAEARRGLVLRAFKAFAGFLLVPGDAHALAAAAGRSLDHHRIADLVRDLHRFLGVGDQPHVARNRRDARFLGQLLRGDLVAHRLDRGRRRPDEDDAFLLQRLGELHVLGQEAVARMHRLGAGLADRVHDLVDHDIGLVRRRRADMHRLVSHLHVQRVRIGVGIDGDRLDPHLARRLDHAAGDLAAVCDQDFLEHVSPFPPGAGYRSAPSQHDW
ncbi:hypothetical protein SDC9_28759 [bioreactor metagenome]|uniref:NAD-specific glutamate dehydrogenase n=1 Tax=bioreactor metagenome TaxID=1076179 RepID=A0A644UUS1_9ZZZZ